LEKQGEMIGALLIVGGSEVVPFHNLPNPVDDADLDVASDNPYATRDENYFIPEWPVGRLPGGEGNDPWLLLHTLQQFIQHHQQKTQWKPWYQRWWKNLLEKLGHNPGRTKPSLGYTAAIWRRVAGSVFRPIGEGRALLVSPPVQVCDSSPSQTESENQKLSSPGGKLKNKKNTRLDLHLCPSRLGYFNLHGLQDAIEWYGHRDPFETNDGPDYPVALRPKDIEIHLNNGRAPQVVFSEACYGAYILGRSVEESIILKFLASGSQAVVGATCTAYGTVTSPLTAADLLGYSFWNFIEQGLPAGEALRQAKFHLAHEMHSRQGYLDGEDQKTLISFVLYGDPLTLPLYSSRGLESTLRSRNLPGQVKVICDRSEEEYPVETVPEEVLLHVKQIVARYLPGMSDAHLTISRERVQCNSQSHKCPAAQMGPDSLPTRQPNRRVVTLRKEVQRISKVHHHYARLTLDPHGKLVKLVVSR
jgi:hypothetical protein